MAWLGAFALMSAASHLTQHSTVQPARMLRGGCLLQQSAANLAICSLQEKSPTIA